jgi:type I thyroxine 5'-deiodinase
MAQRIAIANDFVRRFKFRIPILIDDMENRIEKLYSAWPERIYIVDETGRIAYKGGLGPFKFNPDELDNWLAGKFPP